MTCFNCLLSNYSGSQTRLSGRALTPQEILVVTGTFAHAEISSTSGRQRTPLPSAVTVRTPTPNPWEVNKWVCKLLGTPLLKGNDYSGQPAWTTTPNPWEADESNHESLNTPALKGNNYFSQCSISYLMYLST